MTEDLFHLGVKALICNQEGKVLLLKVNLEKLHGQQTAYWDLPGGRVQKGQTVIDTLRRELLEETGVTEVYDTQSVGMVLANIRIPVGKDDTVGLILAVFRCSMPADSRIVISDEHVAFSWFSPIEAARLLAVKYPAEFCELVRSLSDTEVPARSRK